MDDVPALFLEALDQARFEDAAALAREVDRVTGAAKQQAHFACPLFSGPGSVPSCGLPLPWAIPVEVGIVCVGKCRDISVAGF